MPTYTDSNAAAPDYHNGVGNAYIDDGAVSVPSTFTTTDKARIKRIPGGTRVTGIVINNDDLDSGATVTANFGYEAANAGSSLAAAPTAFGSALTILRAAGRTELTFAPITFNEDVWLTCIPAAGPCTTAGVIRAEVRGHVVGYR